MIGFTRLVSVNNDGSNPKLLGQTDSFYDANLRQFDGDIIDWLGGESGQVLMERLYVPEEYKMNTRLVRDKSGLAVDRLNVTNLNSQAVEQPRDGAGGYMSDGQGHVRLLEMPQMTASGYAAGPVAYLYRRIGSGGWDQLTSGTDDEFRPLAIDAETNQLYALKKKDGRFALYGLKLDGSGSQTLIAANPHVDIDDVVRFGDSTRSSKRLPALWGTQSPTCR